MNFFTNFAFKNRVYYCFSLLFARYKIQEYDTCLKSCLARAPGDISKRKSTRPTNCHSLFRLRSYLVPGTVPEYDSSPVLRYQCSGTKCEHGLVLINGFWFGYNENLLLLKNNKKYFAYPGNFSSLYIVNYKD